ncbi:MAG: hypothetical protein KIT09_21715 [Bryobacteraceae bacterium]|nr:hypothetical protein [Bryobacteraceae bacterium]
MSRLLWMLAVMATGTPAQTPPLRGAGYAIPTFGRYAPGQIISVFVAGLDAPLNSTAPTLALPTTLEGVTVTAVEMRTGGFSGDLPVLAVTSSQFYGGVSVEAPDVAAITVQMPSLPICIPEAGPNPCWYEPHVIVTVRQNGIELAASEFIQAQHNLHILNACDTVTSPFLSADIKLAQMLANCYPIVAHANGRIVTGDNPAKPGETVVVLATGAGLPRTPLGMPATGVEPAYDTGSFSVSFDYRPDVYGFGGSVESLSGGSPPDYAGPAPGMVGIDQINIRLPDVFPPETRNCEGFADTNVGIGIARGSSAKRVRLCVAI